MLSQFNKPLTANLNGTTNFEDSGTVERLFGLLLRELRLGQRIVQSSQKVVFIYH